MHTHASTERRSRQRSLQRRRHRRLPSRSHPLAGWSLVVDLTAMGQGRLLLQLGLNFHAPPLQHQLHPLDPLP